MTVGKHSPSSHFISRALPAAPAAAAATDARSGLPRLAGPVSALCDMLKAKRQRVALEEVVEPLVHLWTYS